MCLQQGYDECTARRCPKPVSLLVEPGDLMAVQSELHLDPGLRLTTRRADRHARAHLFRHASEAGLQILEMGRGRLHQQVRVRHLARAAGLPERLQHRDREIHRNVPDLLQVESHLGRLLALLRRGSLRHFRQDPTPPLPAQGLVLHKRQRLCRRRARSTIRLPRQKALKGGTAIGLRRCWAERLGQRAPSRTRTHADTAANSS